MISTDVSSDTHHVVSGFIIAMLSTRLEIARAMEGDFRPYDLNTLGD